MLKPTLIALLAAALAALALAAPASADVTDRIIHECQNSPSGYLTSSYTKAQLRKAKDALPADVLEYSTCYDQIAYALRQLGRARTSGDGGGGTSGSDGSGGLGGVSGSSGSGGGQVGASDTPLGGDAPVDDVALPPAPPAEPHVGTQEPVELAGASIQPGDLPSVGRDAHALPTPLIVFLALLAAGTIGAAAMTIGRRVIAHRRP